MDFLPIENLINLFGAATESFETNLSGKPNFQNFTLIGFFDKNWVIGVLQISLKSKIEVDNWATKNSQSKSRIVPQLVESKLVIGI